MLRSGRRLRTHGVRDERVAGLYGLGPPEEQPIRGFIRYSSWLASLEVV